jgi:hypothetical protein
MTYQATGGGCSNWRATELQMPKALGYGTYLVRYAGTIDAVDPQIVWSPGFTWDFNGNPGNGFREVDIEHARWGNGGDPTSSQFVLRPLQSGAMPPQWKVRYAASGMTPRGGFATGGGGCTVTGPLDFQGRGAKVVFATTVIQWLAGSLQWYTFDGLYDMASLPTLTAAQLVASYQYPPNAASWVPDQGAAAPHMNLWHIDGKSNAQRARPRSTRTSRCSRRKRGVRGHSFCALRSTT